MSDETSAAKNAMLSRAFGLFFTDAAIRRPDAARLSANILLMLMGRSSECMDKDGLYWLCLATVNATPNLPDASRLAALLDVASAFFPCPKGHS